MVAPARPLTKPALQCSTTNPPFWVGFSSITHGYLRFSEPPRFTFNARLSTHTQSDIAAFPRTSLNLAIRIALTPSSVRSEFMYARSEPVSLSGVRFAATQEVTPGKNRRDLSHGSRKDPVVSSHLAWHLQQG